MAKGRKSTQLAGLAALVGLGYKLLNQGESRGNVPVDERSTRSGAAGVDRNLEMPPVEGEMPQGARIQSPDYMAFEGDGVEPGVGGVVPSAPPPARPSAPAANSIAAAYADQSRNRDILQQGSPAGVDPIAAAYADQSRRRDILAQQAAAGRSRSSAGQIGGAPAQLPRGQAAVDMIPGESRRAPQGGERVTGNELTRNISNVLNAPVPGFIPVGRLGAAGRAAATGREVGFLNETPVTFLGSTSSRTAGRGPTAAIEGRAASRPALNAPQSQLGAPARQLGSPTQRLGGPSAASVKEAERAARAEKLREQVLRENAANYGLDPNAPGYEAAMRALRSNLGGKDFTLKKKGGAIKAKPQKMASGGMSSASKRADGIASKGKTKCKMY